MQLRSRQLLIANVQITNCTAHDSPSHVPNHWGPNVPSDIVAEDSGSDDDNQEDDIHDTSKDDDNDDLSDTDKDGTEENGADTTESSPRDRFRLRLFYCLSQTIQSLL